MDVLLWITVVWTAAAVLAAWRLGPVLRANRKRYPKP